MPSRDQKTTDGQGSQSGRRSPHTPSTPHPPGAATEVELRAFFAAMTEYIFVLDREGRYLSVAPTQSAQQGKLAVRVEGKTLHEVHSADQADLFLSYIHQALETQQIVNVEYCFPIEGRDRWFSTSISPFSENTVFWIARDTTDRKQAELVSQRRECYMAALLEIQRLLLAAKEGEDYYPAILKLLGEASGASRVYIFENDFVPGRLVVSQRAEWCAPGIKPEIGNPLLQQEDLSCLESAWIPAMLRGETIAAIVADLPDAHRCFLQSQEIQAIAQIPIVIRGEFLGFLGFDNCLEPRLWELDELDLLRTAATAIVLWRDRQRTETERAQMEEALRQSELRFRSLVNNLPGVVYRCAFDEDWTPEFVSQSASEIYGYPPEALIGEKAVLTWNMICHPEDVDKTNQELWSAVAAKRPYSLEYRIVRGDGQVRWVYERGQAVYGDEGEVLWLDGTIFDISDRKQAEEASRQSERRLRQQNTVLVELAKNKAFNQGDLNTAFRAITEAAVHTLEIDQAGVWLFNQSKTILQCLDLFQTLTGAHTTGMALAIDDYPALFRALEEDRTISTDWVGANSNPPFSPGDYLIPTEIQSMLGAAIRSGGQVVGAVYFAQANHPRPWTSEDQNFATSVADLVSLALESLERKRTETALKRSEAKYRNIFENSQVGIFRTRLEDGLVLEANQRTVSMFGYESVTEIVGLKLADEYYADPEQRQQILTLLQTHGEFHNFEAQFLRKDGSIFWGLASGRLNPEDGCLEGVITDISKRKQVESDRQRAEAERQRAEVALRESEALFRSIFQYSGIAIGLTRADGTHIANNPAACQLLGYSEAEFHTLSFLDFTHPDDVEADLLLYGELLAGQRDSFHMEKRYFRKDGQMVWVSLTVSAVRDEDGNLLFTTGIAEDITEQKRAAEALLERARLAALTADIGTALTQGNTLQDMLGRCAIALHDHLAVAFARIWTLNEAEQILELQASAGLYTHLNGHHSRILLGQYKIGRIAQEKQPCLINDVLSDPAIHDKEWAKREGMVAFAGYPLIVEDKVVGVMAIFALHSLPQTTLQEMASIANEIALGIEKKRTEEALKQALAAAEVANQAKSQFLSNMSHELRTPLNVILGFTQLLARSRTLDAQQQNHLNTISRSGEHLLALINDVLEMSKIEAGRITLNVTQFDLHGLLDWLQQMLHLKAEMKGLQLRFDVSPTLPQSIHADEHKLRQVLMNLLGNAIKFTAQGEVILRVWTVSPPWFALTDCYPAPLHSAPLPEPLNNNSILLGFEVEDTGSGIASAELEHLFEPFVQTETGRNSQEGTGLGLAISQKFVNLMGGTITVTTDVGRGSTFRFAIPVCPLDTEDCQQQPLFHQQIIGLQVDQPSYRILIAEDKVANRQYLMELLTPVGFEVQVASNGEEAIALCQTWAPHLIWMDMRMPVMNGYDATQRIKTQMAPAPVIIALTGSAFEEDRLLALSHGCDDFVRKPVPSEVIFQKMAEHLGVSYVYGSQEQGSGNREDGRKEGREEEQALTASRPSITALSLQVMPVEWIEALHQAALRVNSKQVGKLIEQIPPEAVEMAIALTHLVDQFRFEDILVLTTSTLRQNQQQSERDP